MRTLFAVIFLLVGFGLLVLRLLGLFGNPLVVDGGLVLALLLIGAGSFLAGARRAAA